MSKTEQDDGFPLVTGLIGETLITLSTPGEKKYNLRFVCSDGTGLLLHSVGAADMKRLREILSRGLALDENLEKKNMRRFLKPPTA